MNKPVCELLMQVCVRVITFVEGVELQGERIGTIDMIKVVRGELEVEYRYEYRIVANFRDVLNYPRWVKEEEILGLARLDLEDNDGNG